MVNAYYAPIRGNARQGGYTRCFHGHYNRNSGGRNNSTEIQVEGIILSLEGVCFSIVIPKVFLLVLETLVTIMAEVK